MPVSKDFFVYFIVSATERSKNPVKQNPESNQFILLGFLFTSGSHTSTALVSFLVAHFYSSAYSLFTLCLAFFPRYFTSFMPGSTNPMYFITTDFPLAHIYFPLALICLYYHYYLKLKFFINFQSKTFLWISLFHPLNLQPLKIS